MQVHRYAALHGASFTGMNNDMLRSSFTLLIVAVIFLCFVVVPVCAVIQEVTFKGVVATVNQPTNTLTVNNPAQYRLHEPFIGGTSLHVDSV